MAILTIPKNLIQNEDLVVLPRSVYDSLIASFKVSKSNTPVINPSKRLIKSIEQARADYKKGKNISPSFSNVKEAVAYLKSL